LFYLFYVYIFLLDCYYYSVMYGTVMPVSAYMALAFVFGFIQINWWWWWYRGNAPPHNPNGILSNPVFGHNVTTTSELLTPRLFSFVPKHTTGKRLVKTHPGMS